MRTATGWAAAAVAVVVAAGWAAARPGEPAPDRVQQLVGRLGSANYRDREAATRELDALGPAALDALRRAAQTDDPETRRRAAELVGRIGERAAGARLLTPTVVAFDYAGKPLADAVADLARRTGLQITLHAPDKFRGRSVTA